MGAERLGWEHLGLETFDRRAGLECGRRGFWSVVSHKIFASYVFRLEAARLFLTIFVGVLCPVSCMGLVKKSMFEL